MAGASQSQGPEGSLVVPARARDLVLLSLAALMGLGPTERVPGLSASRAGAEALRRLRASGCAAFSARDFARAWAEACRELGGEGCDAREAVAELNLLLSAGVLREAGPGEAAGPCGGRGKRLYALTDSGELALDVYEAVRARLEGAASHGVPDCPIPVSGALVLQHDERYGLPKVSYRPPEGFFREGRGADMVRLAEAFWLRVVCGVGQLLYVVANSPEHVRQLLPGYLWDVASRHVEVRQLLERICEARREGDRRAG